MSETNETSARSPWYCCIGIKPNPPGDYEFGWTTQLKLKKKSAKAVSKYVDQIHYSMMDMVNRVTKLSSENDVLVQEKMDFINKLNDLGEQKNRVIKLSFENDVLLQEKLDTIKKRNDLEEQKNRLEKELINTKERMTHAKKWARDRQRELFNKNLILTEKLERAERELTIIKESKMKSYTAKMIMMNENADLKHRIQILETQSEKLASEMKMLQIEKEKLKDENSNVIDRFQKTQNENFQVRNENIDLVNEMKRLNNISKDSSSPEIKRLTDLLICCKDDNENYKAIQDKLILDLQSMKPQLTGKLSGLTTEKVSEVHFISEHATHNEVVANELTVVKDITTPQSVPEDAGDSGSSWLAE